MFRKKKCIPTKNKFTDIHFIFIEIVRLDYYLTIKIEVVFPQILSGLSIKRIVRWTSDLTTFLEYKLARKYMLNPSSMNVSC